MESLNEFVKGAVSDPDYMKRPGDVWTFPTVNIRVINKEGQGFIVTPMDGISESFSLHVGFIPVGGFEFNGIAFIASYNQSTGIGQLGTFPAPNYAAQAGGSDPEFLEEYQPLQNFNNGEFSTAEFNWSVERMIHFTKRKSFDNSLDLYLADGYNPNLAINCGFDIDTAAVLPFRQIASEDFDGPLHHIPSSIVIPKITAGFTLNLIEHPVVEYGGRLEPGNYTVFIRLLTKDFARTPFLEWIGPIIIADGNQANSISGSQERTWKTGIQKMVNKRINIQINTGIVQGYEYFELGVLRRSADTENGDAIEYAYLISNYYPILSTGIHNISINGLEKRETLLYEELVSPRMAYSASEDHEQINDTYVGINWKKRFSETDYEALKAFALAVTTDDAYIKDSNDDFIDNIGNPNSAWALENGNVNFLSGLRDAENVLKYVGVFRQSVYPAGITFVFKDNTETDAFPVTGFRYAQNNELNSPITNSKGLCSTRSWFHFNNPRYGICLEFNFKNAAAYYFSNQDKFADLIGIRIVMGDRMDNLIGQGIMLPGYDHWHNEDDPGAINGAKVGFGQRNTYDENEAYTIPLVDGIYPYMIHHDPKDDDPQYWYMNLLERYKAGYAEQNGLINKIDPLSPVGPDDNQDEFLPRYAGRTYKDIGSGGPRFNKYGLFIPDIMYEQSFEIPESTYIQPALRVRPFYYGDEQKGPFYSFDPWPIVPRYVGFDLDPFKADPVTGEDLVEGTYTNAPYQVKSYFIDRFVSKGSHKFSSYQPAGFTIEGDAFEVVGTEGVAIHRRYNRSLSMPRYVGIVDDSLSNYLENYKYWIMNLYKQNPFEFAIAVESSFTVFNTVYKPVSKFLYFVDVAPYGGSEKKIKTFNGDCFLQKSFFRLSRWYGYEKPAVFEDMTQSQSQGGEWLDKESNRYQHGFFIGLPHESKKNLTYRNEVPAENDQYEQLTYSFMPKCFTFFKSVKEWVVMDDISGVFEAFQINDGYNQVRTLRVSFGYNEVMLNLHDTKRPNRAYYSARDVAGSFVDNFRNIYYENYKDMNNVGGEMVAIRTLGNMTFIIQKNEIIQIVLDERIVQQGQDTQEEFLIAKSREFISDKFQRIAPMGSQHNSSVISTPHAIYGVDWIRKKLWMIVGAQGGGVDVKDMALEFGCQEEFNEFFKLYGNQFNVSRMLPDKQMQFEGVVTSYDPKHREVFFTFLAYQEGYYYRTYVFDERLMAFRGTVDFWSPFYININDDLYSIGYVADETRPAVTNVFHKHNDEDNPLKYYGVDQNLTLTFVVNGLNSDKNYSIFKKIFEALFIDMPEIELQNIAYSTQLQSGTYTFRTRTNDNHNRFWEHSEYLEHTWEVPVIVQSSSESGAFQQNSEFLGKWLKVTITYIPDENRKEFFIRNVMTKFQISMQ